MKLIVAKLVKKVLVFMVYCNVHRSLGQLNQIHTPKPYFLNTHFYIILKFVTVNILLRISNKNLEFISHCPLPYDSHNVSENSLHVIHRL